MTAELLRAGKKLKVVGRAGIGVDNVDVAAATDTATAKARTRPSKVMPPARGSHVIGFCAMNNRRPTDASRMPPAQPRNSARNWLKDYIATKARQRC